MDELGLLNVIPLCIVNFFFLSAGSVLNVVVILCIWKSSQLRKKLCYFMIFVLSCYDLLVILIAHPLLIMLGIFMLTNESNKFDERYEICLHTLTVLTCFSLIVLFTLTLERYLGLSYTLYHKTSVTRKKLLLFIFGSQILSLIALTLSYIYNISYFEMYTLAMTVVLVFLMDVRMFFIARSKRKIPSLKQKGATNFKKYFQCVIALGCFTVCCLPSVVYHGLKVTRRIDTASNSAMYYFFWCATVLGMNSSLNSVIFFWNNSILRSEGKKIIKKYIYKEATNAGVC